MELIQTAPSLHKLVEELRPDVESNDFFSVFAGMLIPAPTGTPLDDRMKQAVQNSLQWVARASEVVSTGPIDLNAANNKIKHGITVRPNDKLRVVLMPEGPNADGNVPLSAMTGESALNIFDTIVVEYISRPPKSPGAEQHGYERTLLRADSPTVLAEAWMLALIHGAIFHTCAYRDHGERTVPGMSDHPGLVLGPSPKRVLGQHVVGMRFPLTTTSSGQVHRPAELQLSDGTTRTITFGPKIEGTIVDDE